MDAIFEELTALVFTSLVIDCPVLSGNMQHHIKYDKIENTSAEIVVEAPSYNVSKWAKTGVIEYTGDYDYAVSVNNLGAFGGKSTKSKHWANKSVVKASRAIAGVYDAEVIVDVGL